jgi:hypothetical protein
MHLPLLLLLLLLLLLCALLRMPYVQHNLTHAAVANTMNAAVANPPHKKAL